MSQSITMQVPMSWEAISFLQRSTWEYLVTPPTSVSNAWGRVEWMASVKVSKHCIQIHLRSARFTDSDNTISKESCLKCYSKYHFTIYKEWGWELYFKYHFIITKKCFLKSHFTINRKCCLECYFVYYFTISVDSYF